MIVNIRSRFQKSSDNMEMIKLYSMDDYLNLPLNSWRIPQPPDNEKRPSVWDLGKNQQEGQAVG